MQDQPISAELDAATQAFEQASQHMEASRDGYRRYHAKYETVEKSMHVANANKKAAHDQWTALLRENDGDITPEIKRLRKEQDNANELAEAYATVHVEMTRGLEMKRLDLADAAAKCLHYQQRINALTLEVGCAKIVASMEPELQKIRALFHAEVSADRTSPMWTGDHTVIDARFADMLVRKLPPLELAPMAAGLPKLDLSDVDMELARSHIKRNQLRATLGAQIRTD